MAQDLINVSLASESLIGSFVQNFDNEILELVCSFDLLRESHLRLLDHLEHGRLRFMIIRWETVD